MVFVQRDVDIEAPRMRVKYLLSVLENIRRRIFLKIFVDEWEIFGDRFFETNIFNKFSPISVFDPTKTLKNG